MECENSQQARREQVRGRVLQDNFRATENAQECSKAVNELNPHILPERCPYHTYKPICRVTFILHSHTLLLRRNGGGEGKGEAGTSSVHKRLVYVCFSRVKCTPLT